MPMWQWKAIQEVLFLEASDTQLTEVVPQKVLDHFAKVIQHERDQAALKEIGIYINYVRPFIFKEKKLYVVGNKFFRDRPPKETFHQFIVFYLKMLLGEDWYNDNINDTQPHFIVTCFIKAIEWQRRVSIRENASDGWKAVPDGFTRYLLALAFDVATLEHTTQIPKSLIKRLKNKNEYQGVRYELAIAAIFARLDCEISFLEDKSKPHCEFIARSRSTGIEIAVEVKSRHRPGIIHTPGNASEEELLKGDIASLLRDALRQNPGDKPFMIFVDLNSPTTPNLPVEDKPWLRDLVNAVEGSGTPTPGSPSLFNAIVFTNYSFHYQADHDSHGGEYFVAVPVNPKYILPSFEFMDMLNRALNHYGNVPDIKEQKWSEDER